MDKLKKFLNINKKMFVFLLGIMIIGIAFGSVLFLFINDSDKVLVSDYLIDFVSNVKNGVNCFDLFRNGFFSNIIYICFIWLLGISVIGIPFSLFIFFSKCFILGFSISSILANYGVKGILFGFFYIFPNQVINLIVYGIIANYSLIFSLKLIGLLLKKSEFNVRIAFNKYFKIFIFSLIVLIFSVLYEAFIGPYILSFIFKLLDI